MIVLSYNKIRNLFESLGLRSTVAALIFSLIFCQPIIYAQQASVLGLPKPGTMVDLSPAYVPVLIKGLRVHQDNPLAMDFIVDTGNTGLKLDQSIDKEELSKESEKLIKYFLAALTLPEKDVWVNLSPYEKDRIIPDGLGQTEMGRDMLAQDYILKQITASLIYPEKGLGKDFWDKVYTQAYQRFGTTQVPVNTFNKVWIVADRATVYENKDTAFVIDAHLKVMLEQDYLALQKHSSSTRTLPTKGEGINSLGSQIVREIILPVLEKEVNQGNNFANLRQIFHSLILAKWYKQALKHALLNQVYSNKNKVAGVDVSDKAITAKIYAQYLQAYKKGVFNFIKEDKRPNSFDSTPGDQPIARKYFSGGVVGDMDLTVTHNLSNAAQDSPTGVFVLVVDSMNPIAHSTVAPNSGLTSVTDEGEGLFGKAQQASARDAAMTENRIFSDAEIEEQVGWINTTATDQYDEQLGRAVAFLGLGTTPKVEIVNSNQVRVKTGFHRGRNIVYIEQARIKQLEDIQSSLVRKYGPNGDLDIFAREFVYALDNGSDVERKEKEFAYAYEKFPTQVIARFPSKEALPDQVLGRITNSLISIWDDKGKVDEKKVAALKAALGLDPLISVSPDVSANTRDFYRDVLLSAKNSLYKIGINALNGVIDLNQKIRLSEDDPELNGTENIRAGMLAFAANPTTVAHSFTAMLKSMADNEFDVFFASVTKGDYRKPALVATFPARQAVTEELINYLFAGLIKVAPPLKIMNENGQLADDPGVNGEEKIREFFRLNKKAKSFFLGYVMGLDHYQSFIHSSSKLKFEKITEGNRKDFEYYVRMPGYAQLLKEYWKLMKRHIPDANVQFFETLKDASNPLKLFKVGAEFPVLDTVGKLFLIEDFLKLESLKGNFPKDSQVVLINIGRAGGSLGRDELRDSISTEVSIDGVTIEGLGQVDPDHVKVLTNTGIPYEVSATLLRNGIAGLVGIRRWFNFDYFRAMHLEILKIATDKYLDRQGRPFPVRGPQLFAAWIRTANVDLTPDKMLMIPRALETLIPALRVDLAKYRSDARSDLISAVNKEFGLSWVVNVNEFEENGKTIIVITGRRRFTSSHEKLKVLARFEQGWVAYFDEKGGNVSRSIDITPIFDSGLKRIRRIHLTQMAHDFYRALNDHSSVKNRLGYEVVNPNGNEKDAAMFNPLNPGGIDLNANQLQLNVQKQGPGVGINFDPAMIKGFENGDFQGFMPVIINIRPITNIASMLGLVKEDTGLSKV